MNTETNNREPCGSDVHTYCLCGDPMFVTVKLFNSHLLSTEIPALMF